METDCTTDKTTEASTGDKTLTGYDFKGTTVRQMATPTVSVREFIAHELALVEEVEAVLTARQDNEFHIWTVVNEFDGDIRNKIYEREKAIIDEFGNFHFDFNILSRRGRSFSEIIHDSALDVTFRRK